MHGSALPTLDPTPNAAAPRIEGTTAVPGAQLAWTSEGAGPLVVWVHGMTNDRWALENAGLYDWSPVVRSGHRLLRYDVRGHGRSTGTADPSEYRWDALAGDLLALIDALSPDEPIVAMGSSSGSATILLAALRAPQRFSKLVITAPPTAWETREGQADIYRQAAELARTNGAVAFEKLVSGQPKKGLFRDLPDYPPRLKVTDALLPAVLEGGASNDLPERPAFTGLDLPTLVLSWEDDPVHPVSVGRELAALLPNAEFHAADTVEGLRQWGSLVADYLRR
jgi:3-oxoadipate enol-lactonase